MAVQELRDLMDAIAHVEIHKCDQRFADASRRARAFLAGYDKGEPPIERTTMNIRCDKHERYFDSHTGEGCPQCAEPPTERMNDLRQDEVPAQKLDIANIVDRFLAWQLPKDFYPDCGISFDGRSRDALSWPIGTNLFTADQARAMFEHCLAQPAPAAPTPSELSDAERPKRDAWVGGNSYEASMLRNLLARIHGDGGHYLEAHGLEKALDDAEQLVAGWRATVAEDAPPSADHFCQALIAAGWKSSFDAQWANATKLYERWFPARAAIDAARGKP